MLIDELTIHARAGRGGDGVVRWLHEKGKEYGGPSGGDGGRGGHVYVAGVRDIGALLRYRHTPSISAENGSPGENKSRHGKDGNDLTLEVPVGSVITNMRTRERVEILQEHDPVLLLKGGVGGRGNEHFKSSVNRNPQEFTKGREGEQADIHIELQLIADIGLIGLPNAGKTSLLNSLTSAKGKVGSYAFTTLEPNLGECYGKIIADIPGLIEGAADGKGLGDAFLRHIRRTRILFHCISLESEDLLRDYSAIREELVRYDKTLAEKEEWIILTKSDSVSDERRSQAVQTFRTKSQNIYTVSILNDQSIKELRDRVTQLTTEI